MSEENKDKNKSELAEEEPKTAVGMALAAEGKGIERIGDGVAALEPSSDRKRAAGHASAGQDQEEESSEPVAKKSKVDADSDDKKETAGKSEFDKPPERLNFPGKLMDLLQREDKPDGIYWLPCGTIFAMNTTKMEDILIHHFQGAKFMSFTRTLNKW